MVWRKDQHLLKRLRTTPWFIRVLVGLFLVAQFSGVVSSQRASALPAAGARALHDRGQDAQDCAHHCKPQDHHQDRHDGSDPAGVCCGPHACCAGALPSLPGVGSECTGGEPIADIADGPTLGLLGGRLDRPPRPLH
jgi:hypothetical protein